MSLGTVISQTASKPQRREVFPTEPTTLTLSPPLFQENYPPSLFAFSAKASFVCSKRVEMITSALDATLQRG